MSTEPTPQLVASPTAGDVPGGSGDELTCHCGYNLRGLPDTGRCPECGRSVATVLGDLEQADLDGRARRRFGAALLIGNHLAWLGMMAGWFLNIRSDLRAALTLLAAAGPRSLTSVEVLKPGTLRAFAGTALLLLAFHVFGVWMLTTVRHDERMPLLRRFGFIVRNALLAATVVAIGLFVAITPTNAKLLVWLNLLELPMGVLLGLYVARLGIETESRQFEIGGRVVAGLLAFSSIVIAGAVFVAGRMNVPVGAGFYVGLSASATAGAILLLLLSRIRSQLAPNEIAD